MRERMLALRPSLVSAGAGEALARALLHRMPPPPGARVGGFWPMGEEIDIRPLMQALHARGCTILLPRTTPRGQPLEFREWHPGAVMEAGRFGTHFPAHGAAGEPDWFLVPLLAFDARGYRLGYGGGYYDRTLARAGHARRIGVAYAGQQVESVPVGAHDMPLHAVATEAGLSVPVEG
ncbi:5-formyltetrahydrofolate cyclo-ligase [Rhodovarius crocodyli]|uniref:5-formyltetrahydrofolate cyclo-ligase n=2 Tax=Rhodovarius crocodyli TaxID=1979269 RepID=A0A437MFM3_9PROT|nr:5-formyltetrahydrofolate cyclo-ligase [Rhodovarius crocodyli]